MNQQDDDRKPTRDECVKEAGERLARIAARMTPAQRARLAAAAETQQQEAQAQR